MPCWASSKTILIPSLLPVWMSFWTSKVKRQLQCILHTRRAVRSACVALLQRIKPRKISIELSTTWWGWLESERMTRSNLRKRRSSVSLKWPGTMILVGSVQKLMAKISPLTRLWQLSSQSCWLMRSEGAHSLLRSLRLQLSNIDKPCQERSKSLMSKLKSSMRVSQWWLPTAMNIR